MNVLEKFCFDQWIAHKKLSLLNNFQNYISRTHFLGPLTSLRQMTLYTKIELPIKLVHWLKDPDILEPE